MNSQLLAQLLRGKLESSPLLQADQELAALPAISAPSLDGLRARVRLPPIPTEDSLFVPRWRVMREFGAVTERRKGERVQAGDEVLVSLVGYRAGRVVPFSAVRGVWLDPENDAALPGLREGLVDVAVGGRSEVEVRYPDEHPEEFMRGQTVVYAVAVLAARAVKPARLNDRRVLAALEVKTPAQLDEVIAAWVVDAYETRCTELIRSAGLAALARELSHVAVPDAVVDADIKKRWREHEGDFLKAQGVPIPLQEQALQSWLENDDLRDEVRSSYRIALGLAALIESGTIEVTQEDGVRLLAAWAADSDLSPEEAIAALSGAPESELRALDELVARSKAIEFVLERVEIEVETAAPI